MARRVREYSTSFSIAIAQTTIEAISSPIITSLTTKSACWNRSQIEIGAPDGMGSPCGLFLRGRCPRHSGGRVFPIDENGMPDGIAMPPPQAAKLRENRAGPHRRNTEFPAKRVQTRARIDGFGGRAPSRPFGLSKSEILRRVLTLS